MARPQPITGLAAIRAALATTTAGAPRGRRLLGLLLLVWIPALILLIKLLFDRDGRGQGFTAYALVVTHAYLRFIVPMATIFMGTGTFGDEWAGGTGHYVVGVPIPRAALIIGRWLACARRSLLFVLPAMVVVYVLSMVAFEGAMFEYAGALFWVLVVVSLLLLAYSAIFVLFGVALKKAVMLSLVYVFLLEGMVAQLPMAAASLSLAFHGRNILGELTEPIAGKDHFRLITLDVLEVEPPSAAWSAGVILLATALVLALATWLLRRKETGSEVQAMDAAAT